MAYVQFAFVCLFFGSNFILMDRATRWFGPFEVGFGRVASAALLLGLLWMTIDRRQRVKWRELPAILAIGVLANGYPYVVQPTLISSGFGHSFFGMTVALNPLLTILVSIPLLGIQPTKRQLIGVLGGLAFVFLLMYDGNLRGIHLGMLAAAVTVPLSYAIGNTWIRRSLNDTPPTALAFLMLATSTVLLGPVAASPALQATLGATPPEPRHDFALAAMGLTMLGVTGTGACIWAFVRMVQSQGPLFAGMVTYVVPVIAMLWGLFDNEKITTQQIIAIAGILAMVTLVQAPSRKPVETSTETLADDESWRGEPLPVDA
ncbi:EamA-like transporter family protein [Botrimarina colliarenosi]|uniref:EamA-like transporter family protein n=1 Tax=Botrimarina colliarenosi TaxID=2528001 RepID=A0A5C6AJ54_9BACT|nr:EamA family transporter [Botrimarina colliarenosi]TWT99659.1 EamA-like transporter family protein [Botrimarina colliarenosi]